MATLLLAAVGSALGGALGGFGTVVGQAIGGLAGALIDRTLIRSTMPGATGPRLSDLDVLSSTEGEDVPRVYGRVRLGGQLIWATRHEETSTTSGGKGGPRVKSWVYHANFAVALCEGPISHVGRIWADGNLLDTSSLTVRVHHGTEDQEPDALILARQGGPVPAYRGIAYVVFEHFPLEAWGNRIPQLTFEVIRVVDRLEGMVRGVTLIPGSTEFGYATTAVTRTAAPGATEAENRHVAHAATDFVAALDELCDLCPDLERIALVVSWFGDDLRAGVCTLAPAVERSAKTTSPVAWSVAGVDRTTARVVSTVDGRPAYGGTPTDASVIEAIAEIRRRGLEVMLYPFVSMDIPAGNARPDPYGGTEQAAHPWRGRVTCHPAPGHAGTPDRTATAASQIAAFVGTATPAQFHAVSGGVTYDGPAEWTFRRMILHYARLAEVAGGVDVFLIGSELIGLTTVRGAGGSYPFVAALISLAADVRSILGAGTKLSYGADWTEWYGHQPADGSGDAIFHLDPLWASANIDFVGIDAYFPLADWRGGSTHLDAAIADLPTDRAYLASRIAGGEAYDWYYADEAGRRAQTRLPISDGAYGKPWIYRPKDLVGWWSNRHYDRPHGIEAPTPTAWVAGMKPIWLTELGCPAVDLAANQPNVFPDPKSSESRRPWFSVGTRDDLAQRRTLEAVLDHWDPLVTPGANPVSTVYGGRMLPTDGIHLWTWDARPFPAFPSETEVWADGTQWSTGHWLNGRLGGCSVEALIAAIAADHGVTGLEFRAVAGHVDGYLIDRRMSAREALEPLLAAFGIDAIDTGLGLRFAGRARRIDATLERDACVEAERRPLVEIRRAQESELPAEVSITFSDAALDHRRTTVASRRLEGAARHTATADLAVVAPVECMVGVADTWLADVWAARDTVVFSVDPTRIALEPGDLVDLAVDGRTERVMIESLTDGTARRIEARSADPDVHAPVRTTARRRAAASIDVFGAPIVHVLDIAHPEGGSEIHRPWIAAYAAPWPGSLTIWRRLDEGSWTAVGSVARPATLGVTASVFTPGPTALWDDAARLDVTLHAGTLAATSDAAVLAGAGRVAVRAPSGLWEVLQYARAELIGPRTWRLSRFLRGQGGSEDAWFGITEIPAGAAFVVLDEALTLLPLSLDDLGSERVFRFGPASADYTGADCCEVAVVAGGRGLLPWSPTRIATYMNSRNDTVFTWIRRSRAPGSDAWGTGEVPLPEGGETYRVEFWVAGTHLYTYEVEGPSWSWYRAQRTADVGMAPVDVTISVAQIGPIVGAGVPRTASFRV